METYNPIPKYPAFLRYDTSLSVVKEHIEFMLREHPLAAVQWLNEVQRLLNRARDELLTQPLNQGRDMYLDSD